ncbi:MAG TPA: asparagine synthase-related protein, partial [Tepidisphaeraceae bacterium]|nr:asparagine synthase-related protein [Tepidisphaeraceae bacterium]
VTEIDPSVTKVPWKQFIQNVELGAIAFASELPALRPLPWVNGEVDPASVRAYLSRGYLHPKTIYRGVAQAPPSQYACFTSNQVSAAAYFSRKYVPSARLADGSRVPFQPLRLTRDLMFQAVERQLVSDVPLGCFLSGGIDSSVVAAVMKQIVGKKQDVLTFSIGFDDPRYDESQYARQVAERLGTRHHEFHVKPDAAEDLPKLAAVFGEPFADSSALPTHYLSRETRKHVKVALSGDGGDELFGGYDRYRAMAIAERFHALPAPLQRMITVRLWQMLPGVHPKSRLTRLKRLLATLAEPAAKRYLGYLAIFDDKTIRSLTGADHIDDGQRRTMEVYFRAVHNHVRAALALDRVTYLPGDLLTKVDRAAMLHALEVRSPYMDHELVQFAAGLGTEHLLKGGGKRMLREAFAGDLPSWVFKRKKMGFAVPIGQWFRGELRAMLHDHLFAANSFASAHFNRSVIERLVQEHEEQRKDWSQQLYALLMLELWWCGQR